MIDKEINKLIGGKLRKLRIEKDIKETTLADILGVHTSTYSRLESGETSLSRERAELLAKHYDISVEDIYPYMSQVSIQDSFHNNSPASGNYNSVIMPQDILESMLNLIKLNTEVTQELLRVVQSK